MATSAPPEFNASAKNRRNVGSSCRSLSGCCSQMSGSEATRNTASKSSARSGRSSSSSPRSTGWRSNVTAPSLLTRSMSERNLTRRDFVKASALAAAALPVPPGLEGGPRQAAARLSIICVGGHPDDPESGCGGALSLYSALGHAVTVVYLTRGERGIQGKSLDEAARVRSAECEAACKVIGAKAVFAGQIDGATEVNRE